MFRSVGFSFIGGYIKILTEIKPLVGAEKGDLLFEVSDHAAGVMVGFTREGQERGRIGRFKCTSLAAVDHLTSWRFEGYKLMFHGNKRFKPSRCIIILRSA
jgi:hypothetical protein